jgi:hypothetical protein
MTEEIYMEQPKGYDDNSGRVCLLKKGLYGTKQGGRIWNENLHQTLTESGLKRIQADDCIYVHGNPNQLTEYMILVVYVDDILIMRHQDGESFANRIVEKINSKYEVKDMGEVDFYLGAKIHRNAQGIMIEQSGFANEVLKRFGMEDCKEIATPMEERLELKSWSEGDELTDKPYRSLVGSLMYLYLVSRPDIGYSICTLSKFLEKPTKEHWNYALRILRYIKDTKELGLIYTKNENFKMTGFADSDWASDKQTARSVGGFGIYLGNCLVSWKSKQQSRVATSTTEAEIESLQNGIREGMWLQLLVENLGLTKVPAKWFEDNQAAIKVLKTERNLDRTKHIIVKIRFIREIIEKEEIEIEYVRTDENVSDIFTKALGRPTFVRHREKLGLIERGLWCEGEC